MDTLLKNQKAVRTFMREFNQIDGTPLDLDNLSAKDVKNIKLRLTLTLEKTQELFSSFLDKNTYSFHIEPFFSLLKNRINSMTEDNLEINREEIAHYLADLLYINYGSAELLDIPLQECFEEVHKTNMAKLINFTGNPIYREDGKLLYDASYTHPNISSIINR